MSKRSLLHIFHLSTIFVFLKSDFTCTHTVLMKKFQVVSFYLIKSKGNFYKQKSVPLRKHAFLHGTSEHNCSKMLLLRILSSSAVSVSDKRPWSTAQLVPHSVPANRQENCVLFVTTWNQLLIIRIQQGTILTLCFKLKLGYQVGGGKEWRWYFLLTAKLTAKLHE